MWFAFLGCWAAAVAGVSRLAAMGDLPRSGARFRDLEYIIGAVLPLLMFISPVFYRPNYLPFSETILWFNPLSHAIELVRSPLLGHAPPDFVIWSNLGGLAVGLCLAFWLFNNKRDRIAFWI